MSLPRCFILLLLIPIVANGVVIVTIDEVGSDVVVTGSGSLNTTGATAIGLSGPNGTNRLGPDSGFIRNIDGPDGGSTIFARYQGSGGGVFGTTASLTPDSTSGDPFYVGGSGIWLPSGYISETSISFSMTFTDETFVSLGINPTAEVDYTLTGTSETVEISVIPESSLFSAFLGAASFALACRRRRGVN
ncbi:MAG: hypothetical protein ACSHYA_14585 [Opitutaceae bacterium]